MTDFERIALLLTLIGTIATAYKAFVEPWIKREKLTVTVSKIFIWNDRDRGSFRPQVMLTFKNRGNQQATIIECCFSITPKLHSGSGYTTKWTDEPKPPKVLLSGETYLVELDHLFDTVALKESKLIRKNKESYDGYMSTLLSFEVIATKSSGQAIKRTIEIEELSFDRKGVLSYGFNIMDYETNVFNGKSKRLVSKKKSKNYNTREQIF